MDNASTVNFPFMQTLLLSLGLLIAVAVYTPSGVFAKTSKGEPEFKNCQFERNASTDVPNGWGALDWSGITTSDLDLYFCSGLGAV